MNDWRRLIWLNGNLISTPLTDFWQISQTVQDPSIPNLPLTTPAGGAAAQTLTQSATYANSNTFYTHVLTQPAPSQTLTQSARHDNSNTFYTHALTASIALSQSSRFDNAPTFYAHTLTPGAVGLIQSARYDNAATFYAHTLTPGAVALAQSARFDNDATFYSHTLNQAGGTQNLTQSAIFDNENTFFAHELNHVAILQSIYPSGGIVERHKQKDTSNETPIIFLPQYQPRYISEELRSERIKLGIVEREQEQARLEAEQVAARKAQQDTEQYIQKQIYIALLNEQIAEFEAQKALILARLIEIEEALRLQLEEEQDIVFCMAMLAAA